MPSPSSSLAPHLLPAATRSAVNLLAIASFFSGAALRICDGLLPRLASDFAITPGTAGRVVFAFAIAYGFSQLGYGMLGDRYGKARVVCIALFAAAAGALACAFAPDFAVLVDLRVLWGAVAGGVIPMSMAWVGDNVHYEQRQATLARLLLGTMSGMTAGQLAGGLFADSALGWRGAFGMISAGYLLVALLLLVRLRAMPAGPPPQRNASAHLLAPLGAVLATPWARVVLLAVLFEGIFLLGTMAYLPAYLHRRFGLALSAASAYVALFAIGGVLYAMVARRVVGRLGERRMVLWGGLVMGLGFLGWWAIPQAWMAAPIALGAGFGTYLFHSTLQTHGTQMAPAMRGTGMSLFAFFFFVGQAIGVSLAGLAFDHAGAAPLLLVPALVLPATAFVFARALRRRALQVT